ncbi:MAG: hypothetical protein RLZ84_1178 [Actinomycetota bacterium]
MADDTSPPSDEPWFVRWRHAIVAAVVLGAVAALSVANRSDSSTPSVESTSTSSPTDTAVTDDITSYTLSRTLKDGMKGDDVKRVQQRLKDLKFDPGRIDGIYGGDTMMAVWAFQAVVLNLPYETKSDFVTPVLWDLMRSDVVVKPRRPKSTPTHVEVYLREQAMVVFKDNVPALITHISSGDGKDWCEEVVIDPGEEGNKGKDRVVRGECGKSVTPSGVYYFYMRKYGLRESGLGTLWNPVYFNYGVAVHGAMNVPKYPASHGCIRIPMFVSEYFPALVQYGDRVFVFDGVKEPEDYGSPPPYFNRVDPNWKPTTTTSSSTTLPGMTTTPTGTVKVTTTVPSATTTTTASSSTTLSTTTTTG